MPKPKLIENPIITPGDASLLSRFVAYAVRNGYGTASERRRAAAMAEHVLTKAAIGNADTVYVRARRGG
jgi:hypothetical protein